MKLTMEESLNDSNIHTKDYISMKLDEKTPREENKNNDYTQDLYKDALTILFNPLLLFM